MKKLFLIVLTVTFGAIAFAQEKKACCKEDLLPQKGDFSMDLQFNPLGTNFNTFKINGATVTGRYFFDSKNALRLSLGFTANSEKDGFNGSEPNKQYYADDLSYNRALAVYKLNLKDYTINGSGDFIVGVGYERHFGFAKRLDPYVGAGLGFDYHWADYKSVSNGYEWKSDKSSDFKNTWTETYTNSASNENGDAGSFAFILGAAAGFDFYVYKGLYLGAELGFKMNTKSYVNDIQKATTTNPSVSDDQKNIVTTVINKDSSFNIGFYVEPSIRIGWKF